MKTKIFLIFVLALFLISFISADNLYNATTPKVTSDSLINATTFVNLNLTGGQDWGKLTCDQKLNVTAGWYNSCVDVIQNGTNCGIVYSVLNNYNQNCKTNLTIAEAKLPYYNTYKWGFFVSILIILIISIIWIALTHQNNK